MFHRGTTLTFVVLVLGSTIEHVFAGDTQTVLTQSTRLAKWFKTCQAIEDEVSVTSKVFFSHEKKYQDDIKHWMNSSTQLAACSFEPGTPEDVGIALRIIGETRTPFAVKGGGHTANPGFSSTPGVQIAMSRFSGIDYDPETQTVAVGAGQLWDNVYEKLEQYNASVVGGRLPGVGVAGFTLGGGYSWLTNQYGLTIDTTQAFQLVLPNGTIIDVTKTSSPSLFFALKGGLNNYGIVTKFTFQTVPQGLVWGGLITYEAHQVYDVNRATAQFAATAIDPKAAIFTMYNCIAGQLKPVVIVFYDAPKPPTGMFEPFFAGDTEHVATRSFYGFVKSLASLGEFSFWRRGIANSISVTRFSPRMIDSTVNETIYWARTLPNKNESFVSYHIEPSLPSLFSHSTGPSAYPPSRTTPFLPIDIWYGWNSEEFDHDFHEAIRTSAKTLEADAIDDGQSEVTHAFVYPNIAIFDTPLEKMYGGNLKELKRIKQTVDEDDVMGLAGGFKF